MIRHLCLIVTSLLIISCGSHNDNTLTKDNEKLICPNSVQISSDDRALSEPPRGNPYQTPTVLVPENEWPNIIDDLDFDGLELALTRQIQRFETMGFWHYVILGNDKYKIPWIQKSHIHFRNMVREYKSCKKKELTDCALKFETKFKDDFILYKPELAKDDPRFGDEQTALFTAYYTPTIRGSHTKSAMFPYAVYKKPWSPKNYSRADIDFDNALASKGLELFYTDDLFNLYIMQIEGGGKVQMTDGTSDSYLTYDGTNEMPWRFISKYMLEKKYISNSSVEDQRKYLSENPSKNKEIFSTCPSYVYFRKSSHEPFGNDGVILTPNRSIATDKNHYKFKGLLSFVSTSRPAESNVPETICEGLAFKSFSRFYLDQDTGGAIRGKARADLYFGEGDYAEVAAHNLVQKGTIYFAMLKR